METEIETMIQQASDNSLTQVETKELSNLVYEFKSIYHTSFLTELPAKIEQLRIQLTQDPRPVLVRLRN